MNADHMLIAKKIEEVNSQVKKIEERQHIKKRRNIYGRSISKKML
jgi:hypothetical protein